MAVTTRLRNLCHAKRRFFDRLGLGGLTGLHLRQIVGHASEVVELTEERVLARVQHQIEVRDHLIPGWAARIGSRSGGAFPQGGQPSTNYDQPHRIPEHRPTSVSPIRAASQTAPYR